MSESSNTPGALPRRYDVCLAACAVACYTTTALFGISQAFAGLRVGADARFEWTLWLVIVGGVAALSWMLRPHIVHVTSAMHVGLQTDDHEDATVPDRPTQLFARRVIWGTCGTFSACCFTLVAGIDLSVFTGKLNLHSSNLDLVTLLVMSFAAVTAITRLVGPTLAQLDAVYRVAHERALRADGVHRLPPRTGS